MVRGYRTEQGGYQMLNQSRVRTYLYKACPRCLGDLVEDPEVEQNPMLYVRVEYVCLQCGRRISLETSKVIRAPAATHAA
jgi:DNA-directed RNA polymerase subunit RPC12/RpoP